MPRRRNPPVQFIIGAEACRLLIDGYAVMLTDPVSGQSIEVVLDRKISWTRRVSILNEALTAAAELDDAAGQ